MLGFIGSAVEGGWNAISNIAAGIGGGASTSVSGFFPTPQRIEPVKSDIVAPAGGTGTTSRFTLPEHQSMLETAKWARSWLGSPYEQQFAIPAKIQESQQLATQISAGRSGPIETVVGMFKWGTGQAAEIKTAVNEFMEIWGLKKGEPIPEGPNQGAVQHLSDGGAVGADIFTVIKTAGSEFLSQMKGLFNLGYQGNGSQPVFAIQHELEPTIKIGLIVAGVIIVVLFLLGRKK